MYAIIETGGKQYRVAANDILTVEKLQAKAGESVTLGRVLLVADGDNVKAGRPVVEGAEVKAKVLAQDKAVRVRAEKFKRRTGQYHRVGHRQHITTVKIENIALG